MELLRITPAVVSFTPPLEGRNVHSMIHLENISDSAVTFKVKTTAPKRYHVQPTSGIIPPSQSADIKVTLSISRDPPQSNKVRDRFQVLSMPVTETELSLKEIWSNADSSVVIKQRLKCALPTTRGGNDDDEEEQDTTSIVGGAGETTIVDYDRSTDSLSLTEPRGSDSFSSNSVSRSINTDQTSFDQQDTSTHEQQQQQQLQQPRQELIDIETLPSEVQTKFEDILQRLSKAEVDYDRAKTVISSLKNTIDGLTSSSVSHSKEKKLLDEQLAQRTQEIQALKRELEKVRSSSPGGVPLVVVIAIVVLAVLFGFIFPVQCAL